MFSMVLSASFRPKGLQPPSGQKDVPVPLTVHSRITTGRFKVTHEEIPLHWVSFESKKLHIMHSSAIGHGAEETLSHRGEKLLNVCETTCLERGRGWG